MAQAPQTISQATALKISDDSLFYTKPSFLDYRDSRIGELNQMPFAKKSA